MATELHHRFTFEDFLRLQRDTSTKHEFLGDQVWAMAGGSPENAAVSANIIALLGTALAGKPCRTFSSNLLLRVKATGLATYPDVSVVCGKLELDPEDAKQHTVVNPRVIVEVLSPSTEAYDRGEKLVHYKQIPSLAEVVLVSHDRHEVEIVRREDDGTWSREVARGEDVIQLASIGCELSVRAIYRDPLVES